MKGFLKKKEKKMLGSGIRFGVIFLCSCMLISLLFVPKMFRRGTNLSAFPMGNVTLTLINDISAEEPPRPFKTTFRDKGRQTQDAGDALRKGISMEIETIWFAYDEETPYLH